jgi:hypothetical protein
VILMQNATMRRMHAALGFDLVAEVRGVRLGHRVTMRWSRRYERNPSLVHSG